jgi:ParB-like nuclease domain
MKPLPASFDQPDLPADWSGSERIAINRLKPADSPRLDGENLEHVRLLAAVGTNWPPILVHRQTMRVVDGMHRLRAARLRGMVEIEAVYFDGDDDAAFLRAVEENIAHGLPLSLRDRKAAALRILKKHSDWSDRFIGQVVSLSPKTVGAVRRGASADIPVSSTRVGRDGRHRRLREAGGVVGVVGAGADPGVEKALLRSGGAPRELVVKRLLPGPAQFPRRDVGQRACNGLAPDGGDGRAVRAGSMAQAATAVAAARRGRQARGSSAAADSRAIVQALSRDPSLRLTDPGRELLRRLITRAVEPGDWDALAAAVPPHCADAVAALATAYARAWVELAEQVRQHSRTAASEAAFAQLLGKPCPSRSA